MSETTSHAPLDIQPVIGVVPDDMLSTVEVEFFPSAVAKAFGEAVRGFGKKKLAFVGVPHQVLALRKLEVWEHKIMDNLELTIGLYCLWTLSMSNMLKWLCQDHDIDQHEITHLDLTDQFEIETTKGDLKIPFAKILPYVMKRCHMCTDLTGEQSDLSIGTAYPLMDWSTVILRTKKAEKLFYEAVESGRLEVRPIESELDTLPHLIRLGSRKANIANKEMERRISEGEPVPPAVNRIIERTPSEEHLLSSVFLKDVMTTKVHLVQETDTALQVKELILEKHSRAFPVVDGNNKLTGIITINDLSKVPSDLQKSLFVREIMSSEPIRARPDQTLYEALRLFNQFNVPLVIVTPPDDCDHVLGTVSQTNVIHALRTCERPEDCQC